MADSIGPQQPHAQSYQQLDPVGGYSTRPITLALCFCVILYSAMSLIIEGGVTIPALAVVSVVLFTATAVGIGHWSSALRAPFSRNHFLAVMCTATAGMAFGSISSWGNQPNSALGPIGVGAVILLLAPYRPSKDLLGATIITSVFAAFLVIIRPGLENVDKPILVTIVESIVPLVAIGLASRAYARVHSERHALARAVEPEAIDTIREGIARSVQVGRVSILNRSVVPFLTDLLQRGEITDGDRAQAGAIADSIRSLMVADVDRSWLDGVIEEVGQSSGHGSPPTSEVIQDDQRIASAMTANQRSVTRALIAALFGHPGFDADGFGILLIRRNDECVFTLSAKLDGVESLLRSGLGAYFAALRAMFPDLHLTFDQPTLTLRFSYDHK